MPDALTLEAAISRLDESDAAAPEATEEAAPVEAAAAEPEAEAQEAAEAAETESEAAPEAEDQAAPEEASGEEEEAPADPEPELPAIEAPRSWDANAQARFKDLPRELQAIVQEREADRDRAVSTAIQEASEAKKAAAAETQGIQQLATKLGEFLPQALKTFQSRWGPAPDWVAHAREVGVEQATQDRWQYDQEREQLGEVMRAEAEAKALQHQNFLRTETENLAKIAPDLSGVDADKRKLREDVVSYALTTSAVSEAELPYVTAAQLNMAHKAMKWDALPDWAKTGKLPATLDQKTAPKPATKPAAAKPAVRPTAAAPVQSSQTRAAADAAKRFNSSRSIEDALALLETRK